MDTMVEVNRNGPDTGQGRWVTLAEADQLCREGWYRTGNVQATLADVQPSVSVTGLQAVPDTEVPDDASGPHGADEAVLEDEGAEG